jgi:crotonobetainyl-CoA:carnitine CoA-transferase CaiB-like acyl-CoA transferase
MAGPLSGVRVIDLSTVVSGPLAGMMLADQGADVIKVEAPGLGDILRGSNPSRGGLTAFLANTNRGKRSLVVDLQVERGRQIVEELARTADVFIQNFRPGAIERLGLGEAVLRELNPELIYVSISGFGESGPYANRRVYDPIIQGLTGNVAVQKNPITDFHDLVRNIVCDKASAYTAAQAISSALFARERGAGGQHIKVPMLDASLAFFWPDGMLKHTLVGDDIRPGLALYEVYRLTDTADGHLIYFAASKSEFHGLFRALDRLDLIADGRFDGPGLAPEDREELGQTLEDEFRKWKTDEITMRLVEEQVPVGPVLSLDDVFDDPQIRHNGSILERHHPTAGHLREARPGAQFGGTVPELAPIAPCKGEHTDEILAELGIPAEERERLRADGVLGP